MFENIELSFLRDLNIHVDTINGFFACVSCRVVIKDTRRHLRDKHKKFLAKEVVEKIEIVADALSAKSNLLLYTNGIP